MAKGISKRILDDAYHTIAVLTGSRTRIKCPECSSSEWFCHNTYDHCEEIWNDTKVDGSKDSHYKNISKDYIYSTWRCDDCDYEED